MGPNPKRIVVDSRSVISNQKASIVSIKGLEAKCVDCRVKTEGPHKKSGYIMDSFQTSERNRANFLGSGAVRSQIEIKPED